MRLQIKYISLLLILILPSCGEDPIIIDDENNPPKPALVDINKTGSDFVNITCIKGEDPDGDKLYYDLYINDQQIVQRVFNDTILKISGLEAVTKYSGILSLYDPFNEAVETAFTFTTLSSDFLRFNKLYNSPNGIAGMPFSILELKDGNLLMASHTHWKAYVMKLDEKGYKKWLKEFSSTQYGFSSNPEMILLYGEDILFSNYTHMIRLNHDGSLIWNIDYLEEGLCSLGNPQISAEGNIVIKASDMENQNHILTIKPDDGSIIDDIIIHQNTDCTSYSIDRICFRQNGNLLLVGKQKIDEDYDLWLAETDDSNNILWEEIWPENTLTFTTATDLINTSDGGFAWCGYSWGIRDIVDARVVKHDAERNLVFDKTFHWDSFKTKAYSIIEDNDNNLVFCGKNGYSPCRANYAKLNQDGDLIWKQMIYPNNIDYNWILSDLIQTKDEGYLIAGIKSIIWDPAADKQQGVWLMKAHKEDQELFN